LQWLVLRSRGDETKQEDKQHPRNRHASHRCT
jgi:hypothetical protein